MVTAQDVQEIERELEELRTLLMTTRDKVRPRLEDLVRRTETLRGLTEESEYVSTLDSVHELLLAFRRGFEVMDRVRVRVQPAPHRPVWHARV
jgi:hypothetical protein